MKKYQIFDVYSSDETASGKAPSDINQIAAAAGFESLRLVRVCSEKMDIISRVRRQLHYYFAWPQLYKQIEPNSIVLFQAPSQNSQLRREETLAKLKNKKNVKFIYLVHDVEELRKFYYRKFFEEDFNQMLKYADCLIVHNDSMKNFFEDRGVDPKKLVTLKIFDYLIPNGEINHAKFERSVSVAGNLDVSKTQYLKDIGKIDAKFNLYGLNFTLDAYKNVEYHGAFPADEIPNQLNSGFGLIWDGSSIETCHGAFGNYLRYNNPHKLSLYLASALPVIIWSQAAEASFIIDNNLGLTIDSLNDLPKVLNKVTKEEYEHFAINAREVAKKLRRGDFTKVALKKAVKALEK